MYNSQIHIGKLIQGQLQRSSLSVAEFARRIHLSRSAAYKIFAKAKIDTQLLKQISILLQHDFFMYYADDVTYIPPDLQTTIATRSDVENLEQAIQQLYEKMNR